MTRGLGALVCASMVAIVLVPHANSVQDRPVVIQGVGAAHGHGLAMDGVEGQARNGWTHDRILDLFYPGTSTGHAGGTIRVGLAEAPSVGLTLPFGGTVSDAPRGTPAGSGFPVTLQAGAHISVKAAPDGTLILVLPDRPSSAAAAATIPAQNPEEPALPTPPPAPTTAPAPAPTVLPATPKPTPTSTPSGSAETKTIDEGRELRSVWLWGTGDPAVVGLDATGHRYRGSMSVRPRGGTLSVVNHVDLETYVAGIAEEKGQAWPIEGLKVLAIAARTLGAATMTWYEKNQANGFDICPTANCQLYIGYDGEEPSMSRAVAETAGRIRTYNGRPILAMYHGNGGGQTESYHRVADGDGDPYPYLRSTKYPFADPSRWTKETTFGEIASALRASGVALPGGIERVQITERGDSPRVIKMRVSGASTSTEIRGTTFADALELRSTWFDFERTASSGTMISGDVLAAPLGGIGAVAPERAAASGTGWAGFLIAIAALATLAGAQTLVRRTNKGSAADG